MFTGKFSTVDSKGYSCFLKWCVKLMRLRQSGNKIPFKIHMLLHGIKNAI